MALNEKQEKFCQAYVLRHNAADAARIAGYAEKYAHTQGYKFLKGDTPLSAEINDIKFLVLFLISKYSLAYSYLNLDQH